ncbi:PadR family transcriptional regulator [Oscillibacter sp.]|uniref:PadR family transcriptional regulator n=1 Tax=Oscillibacter sp. TaxID=1945593 RepID=UPI00257B14E4|nr:PadR family transcriptional regulator [Oscillibacter sp.]
MAREPLKVLTESMFYVLLSLLRQERCGTEIVRYVDDATAGRVPWGQGRCTRSLAKFQEEGLIREAAVEGRKRTYAITERGRPCSGRSSPACASAWPMASGRSWRRSGCCRG